MPDNKPDADFESWFPAALEQEWTVNFFIEKITAFPTSWLYTAFAVCQSNPYRLYTTLVRREIENELARRKMSDFH